MCVVKWVGLFCIVTTKVDYFLAGCPLVSACVMSLSFWSLSDFTGPSSFHSFQDGIDLLSPSQEGT